MRVPWTARKSNQSIVKEVSPEYSLEILMLKLKLKLQYFGHLMRRADSFEKTLMLGKMEKGTTEDEMVEWHHQSMDMSLSKLQKGAGDGEGSLMCCSPWGCRVGHNWVTELN